MKKVLVLALCIAALGMTGCGKKKANNEPTPAPVTVVENGSIAKVEEDGKVMVTMPAEAFGGKSEEMAQKIKENRGFDDAKVESDGSVTFTMSKQAHEKWLSDTAENIKKDLDESFVNNASYVSVKEIVTNDDFTQAQIKVDKTAYSKSQDNTIAQAVANTMFTYQSCNGVLKEDLKVNISIIDDSDASVIESFDIAGNN